MTDKTDTITVLEHLGKPPEQSEQFELTELRRECASLRTRLREADAIIEGYEMEEPPIVRGALDAQGEAEAKYFAARKALEEMTEQRNVLARQLAHALCSWCNQPVCPEHAAPGDHAGCPRSEE